jgi:hypothetical protein
MFFNRLSDDDDGVASDADKKDGWDIIADPRRPPHGKMCVGVLGWCHRRQCVQRLPSSMSCPPLVLLRVCVCCSVHVCCSVRVAVLGRRHGCARSADPLPPPPLTAHLCCLTKGVCLCLLLFLCMPPSLPFLTGGFARTALGC